jgi:hypothetical protein
VLHSPGIRFDGPAGTTPSCSKSAPCSCCPCCCARLLLLLLRLLLLLSLLLSLLSLLLLLLLLLRLLLLLLLLPVLPVQAAALAAAAAPQVHRLVARRQCREGRWRAREWLIEPASRDQRSARRDEARAGSGRQVSRQAGAWERGNDAAMGRRAAAGVAQGE